MRIKNPKNKKTSDTKTIDNTLPTQPIPKTTTKNIVAVISNNVREF